jgi:hypothetical protein
MTPTTNSTTASQALAPGDENQPSTTSAPLAALTAVGGSAATAATTPAVQPAAAPANSTIPPANSWMLTDSSLCDLRSTLNTKTPDGTGSSTPRKLSVLSLAATTRTIDNALLESLMFQFLSAQLGIAVSMCVARAVIGVGNPADIKANADTIGIDAEVLLQLFKDRGLIADADKTLSDLLDEFIRIDQLKNQVENRVSTPEGATLVELEDITKAMNRASDAFDDAFLKHYPEYRLTMAALHATVYVRLPRAIAALAPPVNHPSSPTLRHLHASVRSAASPAAYTYASNDIWPIQKALWALYELDDRDRWQADLIAFLLIHEAVGAGVGAGFDPRRDARFGNLIAGLNLFFRLFEMRHDRSFRHQREKFDAEGFLHFTSPWTYADGWLKCVPAEVLQMAESFLNAYGILEFKCVRTMGATVDCVRLRADLIVQVLRQFDSEKYASLSSDN